MIKNLVSVIIPTYRRPKIVLKAINSVLEQSYENFEIIVVSDGPSSDTQKSISKIKDSRIKYYEKKVNEGVAACRNFGIEKAKGEWIALLDDDDYWDSKKLELQVEALKKIKKNQFIIFGCEKIIYNKRKNKIRPERLPQKNEYFMEYLFSINNTKNTGFGTSTVMAPIELFNKYKFNEDLERHEDWQWLIDIHKDIEPEIYFTPEIVTYQRKYINGLSTQGKYNFSKNWYKKNENFFNNKVKAGLLIGLLNRKASYNFKIKEIKWILNKLKKIGYLNFYSLRRLLFHWLLRPSIKKFLKRWF